MSDQRLPKRLVALPSGVLLPASAIDPAEESSHPSMEAMGTYLTHHDLTGREMTEEELVARLEKLSVEDCLAAIGRLETRMAVADRSYADQEVQQRLIADVAGNGSLGPLLQQTLQRGVPTVVFCEQQLLHLARLAALHADPRPHDDFEGFDLYDEWVTCLIGVSDLLEHVP